MLCKAMFHVSLQNFPESLAFLQNSKQEIASKMLPRQESSVDTQEVWEQEGREAGTEISGRTTAFRLSMSSAKSGRNREKSERHAGKGIDKGE